MNNKIKTDFLVTSLLLGVFSALFSSVAFAQDLPNSASIFESFSGSVDALENLIVGLAFVVGLALAVGAIIDMSKVSDRRIELKQLIFKMLASIFLLSYGDTFSMINNTFGLPEPSAASQSVFGSSGENVAGETLNAALIGIVGFIKLIGHITFFNGILVLKDYGSGKQGSSMAKGLFRLLGGAALINFYATATVIKNTFYSGIPLPGGLGGL